MGLDAVLLVSPSGKPGGAERALAGLARHLPQFGLQPVAAMLEPGPVEEWLVDAGCPVTLVDAGRLRQVHRTVGAVGRLRALVRRSSARAVISSMSKGHVYGGLAAATARCPAIWWQQMIPDRDVMERAAARVPAAAVVCSSDPAVAAQRRLTPNRRVEKVHPGSPVERIVARKGHGAAIRAELGWEANPVVGIVGRLQPWKGQDVFLRAAALVAERHPQVRYIVAGGAILGWEGDYPDELRRLARELGLAQRVHFSGHQDDVYPWFDALDVVVHASLGEPFGLVLVEAMALAKPLVATAAGGPLEIVEDGVSGLLVPPGQAEPLAAAVSRVLDDAELAARLGEAAAGRAHDFSERRMAEGFARVVHDVVEGSPPSLRPLPAPLPRGPAGTPRSRGRRPSPM